MIEWDEKENVICANVQISTAGRKTTDVVFLVDGMLIDTGPKSAEEQLIPFYEQQCLILSR